MKLKNLAFFGVMGAILSVAAAQAAPVATTDYLTTKGYVDARDTATKNAAVTAAINAISEAGTYQAALTETQLNAVNSGITAAKVTSYDGYATGKQDTLSSDQLAATNSGITAAKVTSYDGYATTIAGKQDQLNNDEIAAIDSGITQAKVSTYDSVASAVNNETTGLAAVNTALAGKQASLSEAQLAAANSGITAAKVTTYDGYATGKQDTLSSDQLAATNSGITAAKVTSYDGYASGKENTGVAAGLVNALDLTTVNTSGKAIVSVGQENGQVSATAGEISNVGIASNAAIAPSKLDLSQSNCPENRTCVLTYDRAGNTYVATPLTLDDDTPTPANNG